MEKELGVSGINWIKLLGFRHFETHCHNITIIIYQKK